MSSIVARSRWLGLIVASVGATFVGPTRARADGMVVAPKDYKGSLEAMERYVKLMQDQGQRPNWSDERLSELRTKAAKQ